MSPRLTASAPGAIEEEPLTRELYIRRPFQSGSSPRKPKLVLPGATKDVLKALPEFHYANS